METTSKEISYKLRHIYTGTTYSGAVGMLLHI